jgi:hypothetical protein
MVRQETAGATSPTPTPEAGAHPFSGCFARLFWMCLGNGVLLVTAYAISHEPPWTFTSRDALFWATVGLLLLVRYMDIHLMGGRTAQGEPATGRHYGRYAAGLMAVSFVLWLLARAVQFRS